MPCGGAGYIRGAHLLSRFSLLSALDVAQPMVASRVAQGGRRCGDDATRQQRSASCELHARGVYYGRSPAVAQLPKYPSWRGKASASYRSGCTRPFTCAKYNGRDDPPAGGGRAGS